MNIKKIRAYSEKARQSSEYFVEKAKILEKEFDIAKSERDHYRRLFLKQKEILELTNKEMARYYPILLSLYEDHLGVFDDISLKLNLGIATLNGYKNALEKAEQLINQTEDQ